MKSNIIYCPEPLRAKKGKVWVFLMGPIQGAPEIWHEEVAGLCKDPDIVFLCPKRKNNPKGSEDKKEIFSDQMYKMQVEWETRGLRLCDYILCWIPAPAKDIEGRSYAQTTRFELGENIARGKRIWVGASSEIPGRRYFQQKLSAYHLTPLQSRPEDLVALIESEVKYRRDNPQVFFTSDTHFGSERALELSRRPFSSVKEMNEVIMERWNQAVSPFDTIVHLGDVGNMDELRVLNGKKILIPGNYEEEERLGWGKFPVEYAKFITETYGWDEVMGTPDTPIKLNAKPPLAYLWASHFPTLVKKELESDRRVGINYTFGIFGHIHGRQKIKPWGVDVGVDAWDFKPVRYKDVVNIFEIVRDGHYDKEVWC